MPLQDYPHLTLWKELGFDRLPVITVEKWIAPYQERAIKKFIETSVYSLFLDNESWKIIEEKLRDDVSLELYGKIQDKADDVQWSKGQELIEAQKAARLKGNKVAGGLNLTPPPGGGVKFSNNELWALKECYKELQACIKEARRVNNIPLKSTPDYDWNKAKDLDLAAPVSVNFLGDLFHSNEIPILVSYPCVTDCALEILCRRLHTQLRYKISKRRLKDLLKNIQINQA